MEEFEICCFDKEKELEKLHEGDKRYCSVCNKEMTEGYYNEDEFQYYCSDECLHKDYTDEEYNELYDNGNGNFYYTSWEE